MPFDIANSSGVGYVNGLYPIGFGNGKIQSCDALSGNDYALGGESTHPTLNPDGWADMAVNLQSSRRKICPNEVRDEAQFWSRCP